MRLSGAIVMLLVAPGCSRASVESGVFFPTWDSDGAVPTAIVSGTLVEQSNCLFIDGNGERSLVFWEEGMSYKDGELLDKGGAAVAHLGEEIHGGGGYLSDRNHIEGLAGETIPDRCVLEGPDRFALIYEVEPGRPS